MAKVVVDTNIIISAVFGGKPLEALVRALEDHEVYLSEAIERELFEVILRLSRKLSKEQIVFLEEKMQQLINCAKKIAVLKQVVLSRDAKDDHYLSLCKEAEADFLITGDKDLLGLSGETLKKSGIFCRILTPKEFLEL